MRMQPRTYYTTLFDTYMSTISTYLKMCVGFYCRDDVVDDAFIAPTHIYRQTKWLQHVNKKRLHSTTNDQHDPTLYSRRVKWPLAWSHVVHAPFIISSYFWMLRECCGTPVGCSYWLLLLVHPSFGGFCNDVYSMCNNCVDSIILIVFSHSLIYSKHAWHRKPSIISQVAWQFVILRK